MQHLQSVPALPSEPEGGFRVAVSPGWHPYLRRLDADVAVDQVPCPPVGLAGADGVVDWVRALPEDIDLVHVLAGGAMGPLPAVESFVADLDARGLPLVLTVFDLHDRDEVAPDAAHPRLDALASRADVLTTLTEAAAVAVRRRWDRGAAVVGHPHVAPLERLARAAAPRDPGGANGRPRTVGVPLSSAAGRDAPWEAATAVIEVMADDGDLRVELLPGHARATAALGDHPLLDDRRVRVLPGARLDEGQLVDWVEGLDLVLLPHRHATHSGWVRLCRDLAVAVVGVADPSMLEMGLTDGYAGASSGVVDVDEVAAALAAALHRPVEPPDPRRRGAALKAACTTYRAVYDEVRRTRGGGAVWAGPSGRRTAPARRRRGG